MIAMPGTSDSTVTKTRSWTERVVNDPSLSRESDTSCANAGAAHINAIVNAPQAIRRALMEVTLVRRDFGQLDSELSGFTTFELLQLTTGNKPITDVEFHGIIDLTVKRQYCIFT
jgi:hypothetical protein